MNPRLPTELREHLAESVVSSLEGGINPLHAPDRNGAEFHELCALTETAMLAASALASEPIPANLKLRLLTDAMAFLAGRHN